LQPMLSEKGGPATTRHHRHGVSRGQQVGGENAAQCPCPQNDESSIHDYCDKPVSCAADTAASSNT